MGTDWLLAIETASLAGSIALLRDGELTAVRTLSADRRHTVELLPAIAALLAEQRITLPDIRSLAYSTGPGSFTGLRVAATIARMAQSAVACGVIAVPTLEVIARNGLAHPAAPRRMAAILDAKRGEVYGAAFERNQANELTEIAPAALRDPAAWFAELPTPIAILGEGVRHHRDVCDAAAGDVLDEACWRPQAEHTAAIGWRMTQAGEFCAPHEILPLYLRRPECEEVYEQRRAAARARRGE